MCEHAFVARYTEADARWAVAASASHAEVLRVLDLCPTGGNTALLKQSLAYWGISTNHFEAQALRRPRPTAKPLDEILVENSSYARANLKARLYAEGIRAPICELCGQGELWRCRPMGLILDHINGVRDDNRLANLRIVCPNCAATLDTHCGRKNRLERSSAPAYAAPQPSAPGTRNSATVHAPAACAMSARGSPTRRRGAPSAHRTTSCCRRSRRRATSPSAAATACPTTRSASGCASTNARQQRPSSAQGASERQALQRHRPRRTGAVTTSAPHDARSEAARAGEHQADATGGPNARAATATAANDAASRRQIHPAASGDASESGASLERRRQLSRSERTCQPARACRRRSSERPRRACSRSSRRWPRSGG